MGLRWMGLRWMGCASLVLAACGPELGIHERRFEERDFVCAPPAVPPCQTIVAASPVDRDPRFERSLDGASFTFVLRSISITAPADGTSVGFNLDGLDSGGGDEASADCEVRAPDYRSPVDPAHVGVDNAMARLIAALDASRSVEECEGALEGCTDRDLARQIARGERVVLLELRDVDDLEYDELVEAQLLIAQPFAPIDLDEEGRIAPGQTFTSIEPLEIPVSGDILAGRVRAMLHSLSLPFDALPARVTDVQLRADLRSSELRAGALGGFAHRDDVVSMWAPGAREEARAMVAALADLTPREDGSCENVSIGLAFDAVSALRR